MQVLLFLNKYRHIVVVAVIVQILYGCAFSNEGAISFRKASPPTGNEITQSESDMTGPYSKVWKQDTRLSPEKALVKDSTITLVLRSAFIKDFFEKWANPIRKFQVNGEIAIVAHVFEYTDEKGGPGFNFSSKGLDQGRVIYYSSDVARGQHLNFDDLLIYGPTQYNGRPLGIMIQVLEIDAKSEQNKALLSTLASIGATLSPGMATNLGILDSLGAALMSTSQNDTEYRYFNVLHPATAGQNQNISVLEATDYVFIREERRRQNTDWNNLRLDQNEGVLYYDEVSPENPSEKIRYKENSYLVVQVQKDSREEHVDLNQQTFGELIDDLQTQDENNAELIRQFREQTIEKLNQKITEKAQKTKFSQLKVLVSQFGNELRTRDEAKNSLATAMLNAEVVNKTEDWKDGNLWKPISETRGGVPVVLTAKGTPKGVLQLFGISDQPSNTAAYSQNKLKITSYSLHTEILEAITVLEKNAQANDDVATADGKKPDKDSQNIKINPLSESQIRYLLRELRLLAVPYGQDDANSLTFENFKTKIADVKGFNKIFNLESKNDSATVTPPVKEKKPVELTVSVDYVGETNEERQTYFLLDKKATKLPKNLLVKIGDKVWLVPDPTQRYPK